MEITEAKAKINISLYNKYKIFAYDYLFYYAVEVLFFTVTKGFSMSDFMYITAIYTFSAFFWQLFSGYFVEKVGLKNSIVIGNLLVSISTFLYIIINSFWAFNLANFILALGFSLKSLSESSLLYSSLKTVGKRNSFSKIEGKSNSKFYYLDAISSVLSGFLFVINGYIPIILCFLCTLVSLIMSFWFRDLKKQEDFEDDKKINIIETIKGVKEVVSTRRTKAMLSFAFIFWGVACTINTLYKAIILDIGISEEYSTIVICITTIFVGLGARWVYGIEKITKKRTLTVFTIFLMISALIISCIGIYSNLNMITMSLLLIALAILGIIQGAYRVAIKKYILNFTTSKVRIKITSAYYIVENLGKSLLLFVSGIILEFTTNSIACLIFTAISMFILTIILEYIKDKFGLKPEEYSPKEINNIKLT